MPVDLSIKNTPDDVVARLKHRAEKNHRSLQGELRAIVEDAVRPPSRLSAREILAIGQSLGLRTRSDSAAIVRKDRDRR